MLRCVVAQAWWGVRRVALKPRTAHTERGRREGTGRLCVVGGQFRTWTGSEAEGRRLTGDAERDAKHSRTGVSRRLVLFGDETRTSEATSIREAFMVFGSVNAVDVSTSGARTGVGVG